mgnify:CR=1 FL=1
MTPPKLDTLAADRPPDVVIPDEPTTALTALRAPLATTCCAVTGPAELAEPTVSTPAVSVVAVMVAALVMPLAAVMVPV